MQLRPITHLISKDAVLVLGPQVSQPVETGQLEFLERTATFEVVWIFRNAFVLGSSCTVVLGHVRKGPAVFASPEIIDSLACVQDVNLPCTSVSIDFDDSLSQVQSWYCKSCCQGPFGTIHLLVHLQKNSGTPSLGSTR